MVHSMSQGAGENNNNMSGIYIIVFMEFTGDIIDVIISSFQFFPLQSKEPVEQDKEYSVPGNKCIK